MCSLQGADRRHGQGAQPLHQRLPEGKTFVRKVTRFTETSEIL